MQLTEEQNINRAKFIKFREDFHYSRKMVAEKLGVSLSMISNIENKLTAIPDSWREKIKQVFGYDYILGYEVEVKKEYTTVTSNIVPVPFYHVKAAANPSGELLPDYTDEEALYFDKRWLKNVLGVDPFKCCIIQAKGDSMDSGLNKTDDIKDGDLLLVDNSSTNIVNNKIYIVDIVASNELLVKKVVQSITGKVSLHSNNPLYQPRELTEADNAIIIGRVVWNGSKETF